MHTTCLIKVLKEVNSGSFFCFFMVDDTGAEDISLLLNSITAKIKNMEGTMIDSDGKLVKPKQSSDGGITSLGDK